MDAANPVDSAESLELLEDLDLRSDETTDPIIAAEEGPEPALVARAPD